MFSPETKKVLAILKALTVDTDYETWMKGKRWGQEAMLALQNHYYGKSESERKTQVSKDNLNKIFYRNKTTFPFKKYRTKMKQRFNLLDNHNVPLYEEDKVLINYSKNNFKTEVNICRYSHSASFETASTYLSKVISRLLPATQPSSGIYGRIWQVK